MNVNNPYLFIVGCSRSGTTMLLRMVNAHPQIAMIREAQWIRDVWETQKCLTPEGWVTPELVAHLLSAPQFARLNLGEEELHKLLGNGEPASYASFIANIFDLYGQRREKTLVGNKTPGFVRSMQAFHELWPSARFVHLIRDGRDVCLSVRDWPKAQVKKPGMFATWKDDWMSTTAYWWDLSVRLGREAGKLLGPQIYYEMRYESLVSNPEKESEALCDFLRVPYDKAMVEFHEGRTKSKAGLDPKHAWLPITPGLRNWKTQMLPQDVEKFEAAAGLLLEELGYTRAVLHPRAEAIQQASRVSEILSRDPNWIQMDAHCRCDERKCGPSLEEVRQKPTAATVSVERRANL